MIGEQYQNISCRIIMWGCYWNNPPNCHAHWNQRFSSI